jgi:hypothetical protein
MTDKQTSIPDLRQLADGLGIPLKELLNMTFDDLESARAKLLEGPGVDAGTVALAQHYASHTRPGVLITLDENEFDGKPLEDTAILEAYKRLVVLADATDELNEFSAAADYIDEERGEICTSLDKLTAEQQRSALMSCATKAAALQRELFDIAKTATALHLMITGELDITTAERVS